MANVLTYPPKVTIESMRDDLDLSAYIPAEQNELSSDARATIVLWVVELITIALGGS
jgi:hypothetical protein